MQRCFRRLTSLSHVFCNYPSHASTVRNISCTAARKGIEEFFPPGVYEGENLVDENPVVGRKWSKHELRIKSNSDLHKLWYILLKERNMLKTMGQECKRLGIPVPGPTRYDKVKGSMTNIQFVINERNNAILEMEKERWYKFDEQLEAEKEAPYLRKKLEENQSELEQETYDGNIVEEENIEVNQTSDPIEQKKVTS